MGVSVGGVRIECVRGDITEQQDLDAVVNAANAQLAPTLHPGSWPASPSERVPDGCRARPRGIYARQDVFLPDVAVEVCAVHHARRALATRSV